MRYSPRINVRRLRLRDPSAHSAALQRLDGQLVEGYWHGPRWSLSEPHPPVCVLDTGEDYLVSLVAYEDLEQTGCIHCDGNGYVRAAVEWGRMRWDDPRALLGCEEAAHDCRVCSGTGGRLPFIVRHDGRDGERLIKAIRIREHWAPSLDEVAYVRWLWMYEQEMGRAA